MKNIKFSCDFDFCQKSFTAKKSLKEHIRIHKGEKPYECYEETCRKKFTQYSSFQKHKRIHNGEKPYKCEEENCQHSFTQISNLNRHKRVHTKEKPFLCEKCFKTFTTTSNLKQHLQIHSTFEEREKFKCDNCEKAYFYPSSLRKHSEYHKNSQTKDTNIAMITMKHQDHIDMLINGYLYMFKTTGEPYIHELEESEVNPIRCLPVDDMHHFNSFKSLGIAYYQFINNWKAGKEKISYFSEDNMKSEPFENEEKAENDLKALDEKQTDFHKIHNECFICENKEAFEENSLWKKEKRENLEGGGQFQAEQKNIENSGFKLKNDGLQINNSFSSIFQINELSDSLSSSEIKFHDRNCLILSDFCKLCEKKKQNDEKHKHGPGCGHSIVNHKGHIDYIVEGNLHFPHEEHCDDHGKIIFV